MLELSIVASKNTTLSFPLNYILRLLRSGANVLNTVITNDIGLKIVDSIVTIVVVAAPPASTIALLVDPRPVIC